MWPKLMTARHTQVLELTNFGSAKMYNLYTHKKGRQPHPRPTTRPVVQYARALFFIVCSLCHFGKNGGSTRVKTSEKSREQGKTGAVRALRL